MVRDTPTGAPDVKIKPYYTEELTEGTLPLNDGAAGAVQLNYCGLIQSLGKDVSIDNNKIQPLGELDIKRQVKMGETHTSEFKFQPFNFNFMKYGMLLPVRKSTTPPDPTLADPNNTCGVSISVVMSQYIDDAELYRIYKGLKFNGLSCEITRDGGCNVTMPFECKQITPWVAAPAFAPPANYEPEPSPDPWSGISSGDDPLDIEGVKYDTTSFSFDIDLGMARFKPNGTITNKYSKSFGRKIDVKFNTLVLDNTLIGDLTDYDPIDITYTIAPGNSIKFVDVRLDSYSAPTEGGSQDFGMEEFGGSAEGGIIITET